jgi:uncharacterized membrane protein YhaH (DUF805 family)
VKAVWQDDWASMFANPITLLIIAATLVAAIIISRRLRDRNLPAPGSDERRSLGG